MLEFLDQLVGVLFISVITLIIAYGLIYED